MGTLILALCMGFCAPAQQAVSLSDYQEAQIEWWNYYGEWAPALAERAEAPVKAATKSGAAAKTTN